MIPFQYNDGGRAAAGFKGSADDCVCRAIAIASGRSYQEVYDAINEAGKAEQHVRGKVGRQFARGKGSSARTGVIKRTTRALLASMGWHWVPIMGIGTGCTVHLRADELPKGRIIVALSRHMAAVVDGVLHDTHDCSRDGTRCVYGYWTLTPQG